MLKKLILAALASLALSISAFAAIDLNTATQAQLEGVKGLGPAKAKAIIEYRSKNGPFKSVDDIKKVQGIKDGVFNQIKGEISIGGASAKPAASAPGKASAPKK